MCVAVHGNMGTGELPELFKVWARTILNEKGYDAILKEKQKENLEKLRKGIQNALGKAVAENIDKAVNDVVDTFMLEHEVKNCKIQ